MYCLVSEHYARETNVALLSPSLQEAVLEQQQSERQDTEFKRSCLFCGLVVMGNRALLLRHMLESHGFSVGQPNNLGLFFLSSLEARICIYIPCYLFTSLCHSFCE